MEVQKHCLYYCCNPTPKQLDPKAREYFLATSGKEGLTRLYVAPYNTIYHFAFFFMNNDIYFTGGGMPTPSDAFGEEFYTVTFRGHFDKGPGGNVVYQKLANMNNSRANHAIIGLKSKFLFVAGGTNSDGNLDSCEKYDVDNNKWQEIARLNEKKRWITLCAVKERYLYLFGGVTDKVTDIIERLDVDATPAASAWEVIKIAAGAEFWKGHFFVAAEPVSETRIMLFGGVRSDLEPESTQCVEFDVSTGSVKALESLARADAFYLTKACEDSRYLRIVGNCAEDLHTYDKETNKWSLMKKEIWNPEPQVDYPKSNTF